MRMKRIIILIMIVTAVLCSGAAAENAGDNPDFRTLTGLDELSRKLDSGITIRRVYYTDGFGFSTSEFTTTDETEIRSLWTALNQITVKGQVNESITDWYPQIVFYLSDETTAHVTFESHWLSLPVPWPQANYELENDDAFWNLTAALVNRYESSVHPKENAWTGSWDGRYGIGVQEASEDHIDVALYREDCYDRNEIENLMPGDTVTVNGKIYTVSEMQMHESFELPRFELIPEEAFDGYIVFEALPESQECRAVVNDWIPCTYVGKTTVPLPLPEHFVFEDYAGNENGAEAFLEDADAGRYTPYNTKAWFENGLLVKVSHSDYPAGPDE